MAGENLQQSTSSGNLFQDLVQQLALPYLSYRTAIANAESMRIVESQTERGRPLAEDTYDLQRLQATAQQNLGLILVGLAVVVGGVFLVKKVL